MAQQRMTPSTHNHWRSGGARLHVDLIGVAVGLALAALLLGGLIATAR